MNDIDERALDEMKDAATFKSIKALRTGGWGSSQCFRRGLRGRRGDLGEADQQESIVGNPLFTTITRPGEFLRNPLFTTITRISVDCGESITTEPLSFTVWRRRKSTSERSLLRDTLERVLTDRATDAGLRS